MSDRVTIIAEPRTVTGKKVKQLRREGMIPGVIYGQSEPVNVQMHLKQLRRALRIAGTNHLATVDVNGDLYTVLTREIQQHAFRQDLLHIDFMEVDMKSTITSEAELVPVGDSPVVADGAGIINMATYAVAIECLPDNLVSQIEVDLSLIQSTDDTILVSDIPVPEGVTILTDPDTLVASFQFVRADIEEEEEADELGLDMGEEVEVISRGKEDEDFE